MVTVAPGRGIGFQKIDHKIEVKERAVEVMGKDLLFYKLELDRGESGSNEIEDDEFTYNAINQIIVSCNVQGVTDDQNIPIRGNLILRHNLETLLKYKRI